MVPFQFGLKSEGGENYEYHERDDLLDHFQLHEREIAAVPLEPDTVRGYLKAVLEKCDQPAEDDDAEERQFIKSRALGEFQVTVPREGHKYIGKNQKSDSEKRVHSNNLKFLRENNQFSRHSLLGLLCDAIPLCTIYLPKDSSFTGFTPIPGRSEAMIFPFSSAAPSKQSFPISNAPSRSAKSIPG